MLPLAYDFPHSFFLCLCVFPIYFPLSLYMYIDLYEPYMSPRSIWHPRVFAPFHINDFQIASKLICQTTHVDAYPFSPPLLMLHVPFGCAQFSLSLPEFS